MGVHSANVTFFTSVNREGHTRIRLVRICYRKLLKRFHALSALSFEQNFVDSFQDVR